MKDVLLEVEFAKELYKLLDYTRCVEMATGYRGQDRPNLDNISRRLGKCLKDVSEK